MPSEHVNFTRQFMIRLFAGAPNALLARIACTGSNALAHPPPNPWARLIHEAETDRGEMMSVLAQVIPGVP